MNLLPIKRWDELLYHINVNMLGKSALHLQRRQTELKMLRPGWWKHPHLNPPLSTGAWLKEMISKHYLKGQHANRALKVAWVTSGAPIEFLKALDFFLIYPENHGAVCGIRRLGARQCEVAEQAGYSRDLCSYARTDFGTILSGKTPVGNLPRPDLLICCNNICQTVVGWYQVLAEHFQVPLVLIDMPFIYDQARPHDLTFVEGQLELAIEQAERVAHKSLTETRMKRVMRLSADAVRLWLEIIECGKNRPSPILAFDEFIQMAPIVEMRGDQETVDFYRTLLKQLHKRVARKEGALKRERKRLVWDNLPIWFRIRAFGDLLASQGVALVASTYTNAWGELAALIDPTKPLQSMARCYIHAILNRSAGQKLAVMREMVRDYQADGVILHSDRSCKPYSIGQLDQQRRLNEELGVPALLLEADHNDSRAYAEEPAENRLAAFLEMLLS